MTLHRLSRLVAAIATICGCVTGVTALAVEGSKPLVITASESATVADDGGHLLSAGKAATRIIALAPNLVELVYAAGGDNRLVAVARFSDFPPAARALPQVGDAFALNVEAIARLKPDLIVAWRSGMGERQRERLQALGFPLFESEISDVAGMAETMRKLGRLMHTSALADPAAAQLESRWKNLVSTYANRSPVRVFYQVSHDPLMTLDSRHPISRTIDTCGGVIAFGQLPTLAFTVSWEAAAESNPQLIAMAGSPGSEPSLGRWPELTQVEAVRLKQFAQIPGDLISRMGPRFMDGAVILCDAIEQARRAAKR
ncbi:cobalamin-binding protein [soil metagenome]